MYTKESVWEKLKANEYKAVRFELPDGSYMTITPLFAYGANEKTLDACEWFFVAAEPPIAYLDDSDLDRIVEVMNNIASVRENDRLEKQQLKEYFLKYQKDGWTSEAYQTYSDWHKDLFAFRPNGYTYGVARNGYTAPEADEIQDDASKAAEVQDDDPDDGLQLNIAIYSSEMTRPEIDCVDFKIETSAGTKIVSIGRLTTEWDYDAATSTLYMAWKHCFIKTDDGPNFDVHPDMFDGASIDCVHPLAIAKDLYFTVSDWSVDL